MAAFLYQHTIRFHETDAAGVLYFANGLSLCHSAYEASLAVTGVDLTTFFGKATLAYPIVHASIDFRRPMQCGDEVQVQVQPTRLDDGSFEVSYHIATDAEQRVAQAMTRHVCIHGQTRCRQPLGPEIEQWLQRWAA
jgi:1,4-dihydroxy-2-naphthoyl-CoA hydrolase